ncbi:MAG TPA: tetratricopeptide repeat protein [Caulobacteraceae bacterium]
MKPLICAIVVALSVWAAPTLSLAQDNACPETADRLPMDELDALVEGPMELVREGQLEAGQRSFEALLATRAGGSGGKLAVADSLIAFGVNLHSEGTTDPEFQRNALPYLRRAIDAYIEIFGPDHPEVALAWATLGDAAYTIDPKAPSDETVDALQRAYDIRKKTLQSPNVETAANLDALGRVTGAPGRSNGDPARIAMAEKLFIDALAETERLGCETGLARTIQRNHLQMLLANGRDEAADSQFRRWAAQASEDHLVGLVGDYLETLKENDRADEAARIRAEFAGPAERSNDILFILFGILDPTT